MMGDNESVKWPVLIKGRRESAPQKLNCSLQRTFLLLDVLMLTHWVRVLRFKHFSVLVVGSQGIVSPKGAFNLPRDGENDSASFFPSLRLGAKRP